MNVNDLSSSGFNPSRLLRLWVAATVGGWIIGYLINTIIVSVFGINAEMVAQGDRPELLLASILALLSIGLAVGILQWLVLRGVLSTRQSPPVSLWMPATALGFSVGIWLGLAFMGLGTGLAQWWIVRRTFARSSWWLAASTVGWPLGYVLGGAAGGALLSIVDSQLLAGLIGVMLTGLIIGALTGGVLLWLLRDQVALLRVAK